MMPTIADNLMSPQPKVIEMSAVRAPMSDSVSWAINLIKTHAKHSYLEVMKWALKDAPKDEEAVAHLDPRHADTLNRFIAGVQNRQPVHGRLGLLTYGTDGGTLRENSEWVWELARDHFIDALREKHPLGFYLKATLWLSSGKHVYTPHCDLADGFLFHFTGRKRVRVWPIPEKYNERVVFRFGDFPDRMTTVPWEFDLQPGQILFIPAGAVHEVVAEDDSAVSVSFHMGCPYPALTLCRELNEMLGYEDVTLPVEMTSKEKFELYFFEPSNYIAASSQSADVLPGVLADGLMRVLRTQKTSRERLTEMLNAWWKLAIESPYYETTDDVQDGVPVQ